MLSQYKWYRQFKGGIWWLVETSPDYVPISKWTNVFPGEVRGIRDTEDYSCKLQNVFPETEFYEKIVNIARNGGWKDDLNLSKYLHIARKLRQRGIEDTLIIGFLTDLYKASWLERNAGLPARTYSQQDVRDLLNL